MESKHKLFRDTIQDWKGKSSQDIFQDLFHESIIFTAPHPRPVLLLPPVVSEGRVDSLRRLTSASQRERGQCHYSYPKMIKKDCTMVLVEHDRGPHSEKLYYRETIEWSAQLKITKIKRERVEVDDTPPSPERPVKAPKSPEGKLTSSSGRGNGKGGGSSTSSASPSARRSHPLISQSAPLKYSARLPADNQEISYKIILLGAVGVGKSNILRVASQDDYSEHVAPTIEAEFRKVRVPYPGSGVDAIGRHVFALVWDTGGQERYKAITRSHFNRADGALLVYDVSKKSSLTAARSWLQELRRISPEAVVMLVENKIDLIPKSESQRPAQFVQQDEVIQTMKDFKLKYARCTAKCNNESVDWGGMTVREAVTILIHEIHKQKRQQDDRGSHYSSINLGGSNGSKANCCG